MNKQLRIAYCIPSLYYPSGMERALTLKANYFAEHFGYDIHIILTDGKGKEPYYPLHPSITLHQLSINYDEMYGRSLLKRISGYSKKQRLYKKRLNECLCEIRPDITVSLLRREINFICDMKDGSVKLGEIHFNKSNYREFTDNRLPGFVQRMVKQYWMRQLIRQLRKVRYFVVLSNEDAAEWTELDNVKVIHNPLPFLPDQQSDGTQKQVIAVGRYMPQKGFDRLVSAWRIVSRKHPDWTLSIYGDGMREQLQRQVDEEGVASSCLLKHTVQNIVDKYCESSVFVLSSRYEGFGMVIIEAMACGVRYFVVLSNEDAAEWTELDNVKVIHNPLPFLPDQQSDGTQKQVIAVGRYMPQKGFDRLVSAWRIVSRKHPDWTLSIYGDGMREQLQRQVDEEGVASSCLLKHTVQNIVDKYCESSVFVLSSRYEGFGMVIIEAMACGVPPVSFTCPCGPRDIIADGRDGLLVENGDIEGLAEKICYLIEHEDLRRKMGRQARVDVERFRIEHIAEQWKELFEEALEKQTDKRYDK